MIYEHGGGEEAANEHTHDRFVDSHNADGLSPIKYSGGQAGRQEVYAAGDKGNIAGAVGIIVIVEVSVCA